MDVPFIGASAVELFGKNCANAAATETSTAALRALVARRVDARHGQHPMRIGSRTFKVIRSTLRRQHRNLGIIRPVDWPSSNPFRRPRVACARRRAAIVTPESILDGDRCLGGTAANGERGAGTAQLLCRGHGVALACMKLVAAAEDACC